MTWVWRFKLREYVASSIWIVPAMCAGAAFLVAGYLPELDYAIFKEVGQDDGVFVFSPASALQVLAAIAAGMITFTGFVFSMITLAVQFGSSQFSPRLLRPLQRNPIVKWALGSFVATFTFSLLVLGDVGAEHESFVPAMSIILAIVLLLVSIALFLALLSSVMQRLRAASVMDTIARRARGQFLVLYPPLCAGDGTAWEPPADVPSRIVVHTGRSGVLQAIDERGLARAARRRNATIELIPAIGDYLYTGAPLMRIYERGPRVGDRRIRSSLATGEERTIPQDPAYALRLLADIGCKAMSPSINDPTTGVQALDRIGDLLHVVSGRRLGPRVSVDDQGATRLVIPGPTWADLLALALDEMRYYSRDSLQVMRRMRALLEDLREAVPASRRAAVETELSLLARAAERAFPDHEDRAMAARADRQGMGMSRD